MADTTSQLVPRTPAVEEKTNEATKKKEYVFTTPMNIFFRQLRQDVNSTARAVAQAPVIETDRNASIATTDLLVPVSAVNALYTFTYGARVTVVDGVSSSVIPVLSWTWGGVVQTKTFATMNGNTTTTTASESYLFRADASAPITYATTYASNTPGAMHYDFYAVLATVAGVP